MQNSWKCQQCGGRMKVVRKKGPCRIFCDDCRRERKNACRRAHFYKNIAHEHARSRQWYEANRQDNAAWREENKRRAKAWRAKNKKRIRDYLAARRASADAAHAHSNAEEIT